MQFSNDERHAETFSFLTEVRDYIARWPAHPMNREMLDKIEAHLDDPLRRLVKKGTKSRSGANFTSSGREVLRVWAPAPTQGHATGRQAHDYGPCQGRRRGRFVDYPKAPPRRAIDASARC